MGLLGMMAAGAAIGARDTSNQNVRAQNELELSRMRNQMDMDREALRMKYLEGKEARDREFAKEDAKNKAIFDEAKYQRSRADKIADKESDNKLKLQIEGIKESGRNSRFGQRQALLRENAKSGVGSSKGIVLPSGEVFTPNSPEYRLAADMVKAGDAPDVNTAIRIVISKGLVSQAAGSIQGITEGTVPTARNMSGELFGRQGAAASNPEELFRTFNPKTGRFD